MPSSNSNCPSGHCLPSIGAASKLGNYSGKAASWLLGGQLSHSQCLEAAGPCHLLSTLTLLYNLSLCCAEVMAPSTDCLFTLDLMLEAVPNSSPSIFCTRATCSIGACFATHLLEAAVAHAVNYVQTAAAKHLGSALNLASPDPWEA